MQKKLSKVLLAFMVALAFSVPAYPVAAVETVEEVAFSYLEDESVGDISALNADDTVVIQAFVNLGPGPLQEDLPGDLLPAIVPAVDGVSFENLEGNDGKYSLTITDGFVAGETYEVVGLSDFVTFAAVPTVTFTIAPETPTVTEVAFSYLEDESVGDISALNADDTVVIQAFVNLGPGPLQEDLPGDLLPAIVPAVDGVSFENLEGNDGKYSLTITDGFVAGETYEVVGLSDFVTFAAVPTVTFTIAPETPTVTEVAFSYLEDESVGDISALNADDTVVIQAFVNLGPGPLQEDLPGDLLPAIVPAVDGVSFENLEGNDGKYSLTITDGFVAGETYEVVGLSDFVTFAAVPFVQFTIAEPNTAPTITLTGDSTITVTQGNSFTDPGATATDAEDGDLTASIVVTGSVDTGTLGSHTLTYSVTDSFGETVSITRTVQVNASAPAGGGGGGGGGNSVTPPTNVSVEINEATFNTVDQTVTITLDATNATQMALSPTEDFAGISFQAFEESFTWTFGEDDTEVRIYVKFANAGGSTAAVSDTANVPAGIVLGEQITACALEIGNAYKSPESTGVWFVTVDDFTEDESCARRAFKNESIYTSHGLHMWDDVETVTQEELEAVPEHTIPFIEWGPDREYLHGELVKTPSDPMVYMLLGNMKHAIGSEELFNEFGLDWNAILDVTKDVLDMYETGDEIADTETLPEGTLFMYDGSETVYLLEDGKQRMIADEAVMKANGYLMTGVVTLPADATPYEAGEDIV